MKILTSWKTSAGGIATILSGLAAALTLYQQDNVNEAIATAIAALGTGFGLLSARDNKVSSEAAGIKPTEPETTP